MAIRKLQLLLLCGLLLIQTASLVAAEVASLSKDIDQENTLNNTNSTDEGDSTHVDVSKGLGDDIKDKVKHFEEEFENKTHSKFIEALHNLTSYLPISVEYAQHAALECDILEYNRAYYHRIPLIISAILILAGVVFAFFGYRLIKIVLFLIGFVIGGAITYFIILAFTHSLTESWIPYVAISVSIVVGVLVGILTICVYYIGIFLAGASIGFLIVWFILAAIDVPFLSTHIYVPILIALAVAVIIGLIALLIQKWLFMFGTAVLGGFMITWGVDYYLELGSMIYYLFLYAEHRAEHKPCWYSWTIIPLFVILCIAGFIIQAVVTGRKYDHKKEMKGVCCGLCKKKKKRETKKVDGSGKYMRLKDMSDSKDDH